MSEKQNDSYVLREEEESMTPEAEVLREYFLNREPKKKILLAEKLYKTATGEGVEVIKSSLEKIKEELTEPKKAMDSSKTLNDADCLHGHLG